MLKNCFKIAVRNLARQKVLTSINVLGLSVGLACFSLFMLHAVNEFNFDRDHENADRIFRVYRWSEGMKDNETAGDPYLPMPLGPALKQDFAEVENFVRFREPCGEDFIRANNAITRLGVTYADPQIFEVFSFRLKYGEPAAALKDLHDIVLTEKIALQLFGEPNPIGKTLEIKIEDKFEPFTVTAIAENLPANSSIQFDLLANFEFLTNTKWGRGSQGNWFRLSLNTFVQLRAGSNLPNDPQRLLSFRRKYYPKEFGWTMEEALGKRLTGYTENPERLPTVISVVKNFHFRPFHEEVEPQLFHHFHDYSPRKFFVRLRSGNPSVALQVLQTAWRSVVPDLPFTYSFLDQDLDAFYKAEARWGAIVGWAGGISVFLGCLGLFGLAAVNRTKEIGIRKVLGASVTGIVALLIAVLTVSAQAIKAALANPVEALRYE